MSKNNQGTNRLKGGIGNLCETLRTQGEPVISLFGEA